VVHLKVPAVLGANVDARQRQVNHQLPIEQPNEPTQKRRKTKKQSKKVRK
jgi:hypothetical protein